EDERVEAVLEQHLRGHQAGDPGADDAHAAGATAKYPPRPTFCKEDFRVREAVVERHDLGPREGVRHGHSPCRATQFPARRPPSTDAASRRTGTGRRCAGRTAPSAPAFAPTPP